MEIETIQSSIVKGDKNYAAYINHPELKAALLEYLSIRRARSGIDLLFMSQKGSAFTPNNLSQLLLKM